MAKVAKKKSYTNSSIAKKAAAGIDLGKRNNGKTTGFSTVAKKASKEYGSAAAGKRVAGAIYQHMRKSGKL